jgi:hypothetical protein
VVAARELVTGQHVVVEQPAVVDDARDHAHPVALRGRQRQLAGPRLERAQDQHGPVDQLAVALEAADHVEREAVGRAGRHSDLEREALVAQLAQPLPDLGGLEAAPVRVVQQQHVEGVHAEPLQAALRRHADVVRVAAGTAQARVREAGKALGAVALALVEVVADRSHERIVGARHAGQGTAEQGVRLAGAVRVGGHHGADAVARAQQRLEPLVGDRFAEAHEAPTAPGADCDVTEHRPHSSSPPVRSRP